MKLMYLLLFYFFLNFAAEIEQIEPNYSIEGFDPKEEDLISLSPFKELIEKQHKKGKGYLLVKVTSQDDKGVKYTNFYNGFEFVSFFFPKEGAQGKEVFYMLDNQNKKNFYKELIQYPAVPLKRLNELGLAIGLQQNHYLDSKTRSPIIQVEFFNIKPDNKVTKLSSLKDILFNKNKLDSLKLYIIKNYSDIRSIIDQANDFAQDQEYQKAYLLYSIASSSNKDPQTRINLIFELAKAANRLAAQGAKGDYEKKLYKHLKELSEQNIDHGKKEQAIKSLSDPRFAEFKDLNNIPEEN